LPPVGTFTVADPQNWVALAAFFITAITAGELSARVRKRAEEAESGKREVERLYRELQAAFERASEAEALRRSEQLKSALLDAVTHDLRTPLTSIKVSVTTLLAENLGNQEVTLDEEGQRELLQVINEEADRLNRFVENMVELARIEAGQVNLRRRWMAVDEIISSALERAAPLTPHHKIEIEIEDELPSVRVDAAALAEVIYTLIDNATRYSPAGSRILITAARENNEMIRFTVEDEGQGIPVELRQRVFDKFFRAAQDKKRQSSRASGLGMGLAIARGIIDAHSGRIWIEDRETAKGTRIALTIPIGDEEENVISPQELQQQMNTNYHE
ncbi:MAG TPA: ATP-binding protein, partial [Blastocatellia bacterium]|nr:ATP-binding protein [Blastocatellia bacterium]